MLYQWQDLYDGYYMHESQFAHLVLQTASYSKVHSTVTRLLFFIAILSFFFLLFVV